MTLWLLLALLSPVGAAAADGAQHEANRSAEAVTHGGDHATSASASAVSPTDELAPVDAFIEGILLYIIDIGIFTIAVAVLLCLTRIIKGPDLVDRGVASDTVAVQVAALVLLITIRVESLIAFDAVLIVSILGFVSTLAFAQYIGRRRSVHQQS